MTDEDRTPQQKVEALSEVYAAARRLSTTGLATNVDGNRGITNDGMQTLADLLTVLMVQTQSGNTHTERVAGATARAMLSALGDLYAVLSGTDPSREGTNQLLRNAVKEARKA